VSRIRRSRVSLPWIVTAVLGSAAIAGCGSSGHPSRTAGARSGSSSALQFARCMRVNGVPNFPDPDANGDIQFPISSAIPQSPSFQDAQNGPCKRYLTGG
jgi:hypothetical protein